MTDDASDRRPTAAPLTGREKIERLHGIVAELIACPTEERLFERTVGAAERILAFTLCYVGIEEDGYIVPRARSSDAGADSVRLMSIDEGIAGRTYRTGESSLIAEVGSDDDERPARDDYRSAISVPIGDYGVFQAVSTEANAFGEDDLELAELLASQVAETLRRIRSEHALRAREAELAQQNERLTEFAAIVSHDLRNPLNVAQGHLELARRTGDDVHFDRAADAHDRMTRLIDDLLTLARHGEVVGATEPVDVRRVAEAAWANVTTEGAALLTAPAGVVEADSDRLLELFENLFRNVAQHAGADASVMVGPLDAAPGSDATADPSARRSDGAPGRDASGDPPGLRSDVGFFVEDDGPGIPAADRRTVFEAGHTTVDRGTGFGLAIVEQIADAHGWTVSVTGGKGGGARFEIRTWSSG